MNKAFFLDRDGVINAEVDYLFEPDKVVILPGVVPALKRMREHGFLAVVVTNQSVVARGMYAEEDVHAVHERIRELRPPKAPGWTASTIVRTTRNTAPRAAAASPEPRHAAGGCRDFDIAPGRSAMVGDRLSDIAAGRAAGAGPATWSKPATAPKFSATRTSAASKLPKIWRTR